MDEAERIEERTAELEGELAVARGEVEDAAHCRDEFLAMLSHELRNPLNAVTTAATLLRPLNPEQEKLVGILRRQSARLAHLLGELLEASRVTQRKVTLRRTMLDVREVVSAAAGQLEPLFEERGVGLELDVEDELIVEADPARLEQALTNLLDNGARYTSRGGHVTLTARRERDSVVVRVADDGAGLAPNACREVFDLFVQADRTIDRAAGGLGVGLAIVRAIVEQHGGSVRAESEGPGHGSCFIIELPRLTQTDSGIRTLSPSILDRRQDR